MKEIHVSHCFIEIDSSNTAVDFNLYKLSVLCQDSKMFRFKKAILKFQKVNKFTRKIS